MRSICISALAVLAISVPAIAETHTVLANNTSFSPDAIEVAPGDTIVWQYNSGYPHTVTSGVPCTPDALFFSELHSGNPTFTWEVPLEASGEITYFCEPHCSMGMGGVITVVGGDCPGDVDGNGEVGVDDLLWLLGEYATDCSGGCDSDLDGNGEVNVDDLLALLGYYGDICN